VRICLKDFQNSPNERGDYWLNLMAQRSLSPKTTITGNLGYLFAGNTSTGALGIQIARGHVFPRGFSLLHDFRPSLTLGAEVFGAYTENGNLGKSQVQAMAGGQYVIRKGLTFCFGMLGGKYVASPRFAARSASRPTFLDFLIILSI
jgi:hypothetical protein